MISKISTVSIFSLMWILIVLYPNLFVIPVSIYRLFEPPISTNAIELIAEEITNKNPEEIESYVLEKIEYRYDWEVYGYPWYFPTTEEVIKKGQGDCKSRLIVIASIFEYYEISYTFLFSVTHIWIEYDGKIEKPSENNEIAMFSKKDGFKVPETDWKSSKQTVKKGFWDYIPKTKKINLLSTPFFSFLLLIIPKKEVTIK